MIRSFVSDHLSEISAGETEMEDATTLSAYSIHKKRGSNENVVELKLDYGTGAIKSAFRLYSTWR